MHVHIIEINLDRSLNNKIYTRRQAVQAYMLCLQTHCACRDLEGSWKTLTNRRASARFKGLREPDGLSFD